jgi:hypothetical protein
MLLILIPIAWLALATLTLAICRAAARGDGAPAAGMEDHLRSIGGGLVIFEEPPAVAAGSAQRPRQVSGSLQSRRPLQSKRPAGRRRRVSAHPTR